MEPITFFGIVLIAAGGAILAKNHRNSNKIEEIRDRLSSRAKEEMNVIDEEKEKEIKELITGDK